jgi:hypothetical protein
MSYPYDFTLVNCDTDSIMFCKPNQTPFTPEERQALLDELNSLTPDMIIWEDDDYFESVLVVKTKNYALYDGSSVKIKGSALKATTKEPALREMTHRMIKSLLGLEPLSLPELYLEYVKEAYNVRDIKRWGSKKSVTSAVLKPKRSTEERLLDAIQGKGLQLGEKFFVYFDENKRPKCIEDFDGNYDKPAMLKKVYAAAEVFKTVYDVKANLPNYALKRNLVELDRITGKVVRRPSSIKKTT